MGTQRRPLLPYNPYKARLAMNGAISLGTVATWDVIPFDTVTYDPNGNCTTGASAKYTVPVSGDYLIIGRWSVSSLTATDTHLAVFVNGSELFRVEDATGPSVLALGGGDIRALTAGDTVDLRYFLGSNTSSTANAATPQVYLTVRYLGPS